MNLNGTAPMDFGEHALHAIHPHNHDGQPDGEPPFRRDQWCSGRWFCMDCRGTKGNRKPGTWFDGPRCVRPKAKAAAKGSAG